MADGNSDYLKSGDFLGQGESSNSGFGDDKVCKFAGESKQQRLWMITLLS